MLLVASYLLLAYPWWKLGTKPGLVGNILWLVAAVGRTWNLVSPKHMKLLQRGYTQRKLAMYMLVQDLSRASEMTDQEVERFRSDALALIAQYVRDHRLDMKATEIFVNLLVEEGEDLVVVARDRPHRIDAARYPKAGMLAVEPFTNGESAITGDVYRDFPETPPNKPYRSILAIPVRNPQGQIVGVVSIDSPRRYHFDRHQRDLSEGLSPYVALLAWTLKRRVPKVQEGERAA